MDEVHTENKLISTEVKDVKYQKSLMPGLESRFTKNYTVRFIQFHVNFDITCDICQKPSKCS